MNRKELLKNPTSYFLLTIIFYAVFEALNATVVCRDVKTIASTGLFSFLGFWSLAATIVLTIREGRNNPAHRWLWFALPALIIALFAFDFYLARNCVF